MTGAGVLVGGAINTDLVARVRHAPEAGETVTGSEFNVFGGGKGANQALAAARSGARTIMLGGLGDDDFGRQRLADLRADGIDTASVRISDRLASGVALITVEDSGQNRIAYVPGATLGLLPSDGVDAFERSRPAVVLTTLELPLGTLRQLYRAARAAGAKIVLNATPEPESGAELVPLCDVLIVNETESLALLGGSGGTDWPAAAASLQRLGPSRVIITLGADGVVGRIDDRLLAVPAPAVKVVDTTGAGDAFCGAYAARLSEGAGDAEAIKSGLAAGSLAVTVAGAQRSMPRRSEVDALAARIAVDGW
jgi:ribokinase